MACHAPRQRRAWRSIRSFHHAVTTLAALLVGIAGSGLFSHGFEPAPPAHAAIRANLRRAPGVRAEFEIVLPDGRVTHTARYARTDLSSLEPLHVGPRCVALQLTTAGDGLIALQARAVAVGPLTAFSATAMEGSRTLWRVALHDGLATLRVHLKREYLPT